MSTGLRPRLPLAPLSVGLLAGIAAAAWLPCHRVPTWATLAAIGVAPPAWRARGGLGSLALALAAAACGAWIEDRDRSAHAARAAEIGLPDDGAPVELHVRGRLLEPPEPSHDGEIVLRLEAWREREGRGPAGVLSLLLRVAPSPGGSAGELRRWEAGDEVRAWCRLRRPVAPRTPGSRAFSLRARGLDAVGTVKSPHLVELVARGRPGLARWAGRAKLAARLRLDRWIGVGTEPRALAGALLLGDRAALEPEANAWLRQSGLVHVVSISGLHVGLVVLALAELLRRVGAGPRLRLVVLAPFLLGFCLLVGPRSPVQRAALGAGAMLLGQAIGRAGNALNALLAAAAVLAAAQPAVLQDVSFQLTFLATGGIVLLARPLAAGWPLARALASPLAAGLAAYHGTSAALAWHFGMLAPLGVIWGVPAVPLCGVALLAGYASVLAPLPVLAALAARCTELACDGLIRLSAVAVGMPGTFTVVPRPAGLLLALHGTALALRVAAPGRSARFRIGSGALIGLASVWLHLGPPPPAASARIEASVLDVGQGLAVVLRGPGGVVAVDAGGSRSRSFDPGERIVVPYLLAVGARRVEALVVTHEDLDHAGGTFALVRLLEVGEVWLGPGHSASPRLAALVDLARRNGAAVIGVAAGKRGEPGGIPLRVLAPVVGQLPAASNARSLVLAAGTEPARLLIPGDIARTEETGLLEDAGALRSEALVLAHHGSRSGSGRDFLDAVGAWLAIASVGRHNSFGHPHPETVERVSATGARLLRTDRDGWVHLVERSRGWIVLSDRGDRPGSCRDGRLRPGPGERILSSHGDGALRPVEDARLREPGSGPDPRGYGCCFP